MGFVFEKIYNEFPVSCFFICLYTKDYVYSRPSGSFAYSIFNIGVIIFRRCRLVAASSFSSSVI